MDNTREGLDVENPTEKTNESVGGVSKSVTTGDEENKSSSSSKWSIKEICNPKGQFLPIWKKIFVISCLFAVSLDPLFFYILIIDQNNKCLQMDNKLSFVAVFLRTLTDLIFLVHFIFEIYEIITTDKTSSKTSETTPVPGTKTTPKTGSSMPQTGENFSQKPKPRSKGIARKMSISLVIDFLALLPIPQTLIVVAFKHMRGSGYLEHKKIMNIFLLGQYLPRMYRIHHSSFELKSTTGLRIKGLFNFFLYILASHVLGAFWYFFSIQREMSCWHSACVKHSIDPTGCANSFHCSDRTTVTSRNITFLNTHCSLDTPDNGSPPFHFGIFLDSLKNQHTEHVKFGKKFFYSFWWGLRNLSNFGTNLTTSTYVGEILFAIFISIIGLLLFLYLIGNVQTFMQMETTKFEEIRRKIKLKKQDVHTWISTNGIPDDMKKEIMKSIEQKLKENKDADIQNFFSIMSPQIKKNLKRLICLNAIKKIQLLQNMNIIILETMCDYLKHMTYNENSFVFRRGDPLDHMLFITEGTIWTYSSSSSSPPGNDDHDNSETRQANGELTTSPSMATRSLGKGEFYGEELLTCASRTFTQLPTSHQHVKTQTKVEAFALMATDLEKVVSRFPVHWTLGINGDDPHKAANILRILIRNRRAKCASTRRA